MGDARAVVQMREDDKGDKKKAKGADVEVTALPAKALEAPGEVAGMLSPEHLARLVSTLQMAGGNTAVQSELTGLQEGRDAAVKGKTDKDAFDAMSDGEKLNQAAAKRGGQMPEPSGKQPPEPGTPPPGMESPASVVAFLSQRAGQLQQLAAEYGAMQAKATEISALAGLDADAQAAFAEAAAYYGQMGAEYQLAIGTYMTVAADMASNEFAAMATPPVTAGAMYQERLAILAEQRAALIEAAASQAEAAAAVDGEMAAKDAELAGLEAEAAAAAEAEGGDTGGVAQRLEAVRAARAGLDAKKASKAQLAASLEAKAAQLDMLMNAYNVLLGGAAATPTGRPGEGGG